MTNHSDSKVLISISSWIVYLLPLTLLTGPFLSDLSIVIVNIIFIYFVVKGKEWKYLKNKFTYFFSIFYLYLLLSSLLSENIILSLESSLFYFRFFIFSLAVWLLIEKNKKFLKTFTNIFIIIFIFVIIDGFVQFIFGSPILYPATVTNNRLMLSFNEKLVLGNYISRLFPLLVGLMLYKYSESKSSLLLLMLLLISSCLLVYLSGERTAAGLMIISTVLLIVMISKDKLVRIFTFLIALVFVILITLSSGEIKKRMIDTTLDQMNFNSPQYRIIIFSPEHDSIYRSSINMFLSNPLIGIGPKNFRIFCDDKLYKVNDRGCSTHSHNNYIQSLAETGFIGFSFLVFIVLYIFREVYFNIKSMLNGKQRTSDFQVCLLICFILTLFPFLPTLSLFSNWINIIYYLPVGFYLYEINSNKSNS